MNWNWDTSTLLDSILPAENILPEPVARIGISKLDVDKYVMTVNVWVNAHGYYDLLFALNEKLVADIRKGRDQIVGM